MQQRDTYNNNRDRHAEEMLEKVNVEKGRGERERERECMIFENRKTRKFSRDFLVHSDSLDRNYVHNTTHSIYELCSTSNFGQMVMLYPFWQCVSQHIVGIVCVQ